MDVPNQHEKLSLSAQLRLLLFSLWALYYITRNARARRADVQLRTWVRLVIITLVGVVILFLDARPPSRAYSIRQYLFEGVVMVRSSFLTNCLEGWRFPKQ